MKIRFLTILIAIMAPMLAFSQSFVSTMGGTITNGAPITSEITVAGVEGSAVPGGTCTAGNAIADLEADALLGYNVGLNVVVNNLSHSWAADLEIVLTGPDGTVYDLMLDQGGSADFTAAELCFDPTSETPASDVDPTAPDPACYAMAVEPVTFTCVANGGTIEGGTAANGTWSLTVTDDAGGDDGSFDGWTMEFSELVPSDDLLACCIDPCELVGEESIIVNLEPGECEEIVSYAAPTLTGGPTCNICADFALPTFPATSDGAAGAVVTDADANGLPETIVVTESSAAGGGGSTNAYTITATGDVTLGFDYSVGNTFWDPFTITGPTGVLVEAEQFAGVSGSLEVPLVAGDEIVIETSADDGFTDGADITISNITLVGVEFPCYILTQLSGPVSGEFTAPGDYSAEYVAEFNAGLGDVDEDRELTFTTAITVAEFSGTVSTALACNDHVNISADENCSITIGADLFLEGGPYGCYSDFEVNILVFGSEATQTGNVNGATIDFGSLLGTHTYEITDPTTGNKCWGTFTAEDKLAPTVECGDYTINCTDADNPSPLPPFSGTIAGGAGTLIDDGAANSVEFTITVDRACPSISDLNVGVDITHTWGQDMDIVLISPEGTEVQIVARSFGCGAQDDMFFVVDDEAPTLALCADLIDGGNISFEGFGNGGSMAEFEGEDPAGDWTVIINDNAAGDGGVVNAITLIFEDCAVPGAFPEGDACGNTSFTFSDTEVDNGCEGTIITRTWFATDASGNMSEGCVQTITVESIGIEDILLPPALIELTCGSGTSPDDIVDFFDNPMTTDIQPSANCTLDVVERNEGHMFGYPHYMQVGCDGAKHAQIVDNNVCNIYATFADQEIPACGVGCNGNVKVIRTWTLLDWCTNETVPFTQLIKAVDNEGPTFELMDVTVSTDPWGCEANIEVPQPWELHDNCTDDLTYTVSGPAGVVIVGDAETGYTALGAPKGVHTFTYTASDCCGNVTSTDATFTVIDQAPPVAVAKQNIVISLTSSGTNNTGIAKLFAESVDNGSHDGCTDIKIEIRRDEDICDIRGNDTYNADGHPQDGSPNPNSPSFDSDGGAFVKFCCEDITNSTVDVNGDGENDPGYVKVWMRVFDDGDMDGVFGSAGDNYNETWVFVKVEDKLAPAIVCPPDVTLTCDMDYTDLNMTGSADGFASCGGIDVEFNDIIVNLNSCNEGFVRRRWNIVGRSDIFCDQTITLEGIDAPVNVSFSQVGDFTAANCPDMISLGEPTWLAGPCDVLGYTVETDTFRFEDGACYKLVNNWTVINWCDYEPNNPFWDGEGLFEHVQVIKVTDETKPVIEDCEDKMFAINDNSDSDGDGDVCEAKITLTNVATDPGSDNCPTGWLKWQVFVDLWGDGTNDLEYSSFLPPFDSQFNDTNGNGIPDVYLSPTANGETVSVPLPDIAGSMSNHKVFWKVTDGCNNVTTCDYEFMVVDKKAPTPYCISVSTAVMDMGPDGQPGVELWASDFNIGSFDNCTAQEDLLYSFSGTSFVPNRTFGCDDVANSPVEVQMYVWDEKGNNDFCSVFLTIVDNQGLCEPDGTRMVAGNVNTESGTPVSDVEASLASALPEYPKTDMTDDFGFYSFNVAANNNYMVDASKDVDYLNGVSTLDLVKIQRHILGLENLDSPYKLIAADINADNSIKASDLSQLRKLILGVITDLPTNDSWRFVNASQNLDMDVDLATVNYEIEINNISSDMMDSDLVGVKVGDVTDNAVANLQDQTIEVRSNNTLDFEINNDAVVAGETVEVSFTSNDFAEVFGYQFTMELNGLEFANVQNGAVVMTDANVGVLAKNLVTVSYNNGVATTAGNGEAVFTATFVATKDGNIGDMIDVTSKVTNAEAYVGNSLEVRDVTISTRGDVSTVATTELFQNEPNPFKEQTVVSFNLAEAAQATLTVFDVTGKMVTKETIAGVRGYNNVTLNANQLGTSGVLYYTLESGEFTATKKMIVIK
jgi:subtilisin-like proprotein convertase family protein